MAGSEWLAALLTEGARVIGPLVDQQLLSEVRCDTDAHLSRFRDGDRSENYWYFNDGAGDVLYRVHGLEAGTDGPIKRLQRHPALLKAAAEALKVDEPVPTVAALIVKQERRGAVVPWHQDRPTAGPRSGVNLTVYLQASDTSNGCVTFVVGSHRLRSPVDVGAVVGRAQAADLLKDLTVEPGSVSVHDVRLVHSSGPNSSDRMRLAIVLEYIAPGISFDGDGSG